MNRGLWIARKNYLCTIIKKCSEIYDGDDIEFLRTVCKEVIAISDNERIEESIACYEGVLNIAKENVCLARKKNTNF